MADTRNLSFFIKKGELYLPFKFYTKKWDNGNFVAYYYLKSEDEREKLNNRWRILNHCGKEFVANEGTEWQTTTNPNEIVAFPNTFHWERILFMILACFAGGLLGWIVEILYGEKSDLQGWMIISLGASSFFAFLMLFFFLKTFEYKYEAKLFNSNIIPDELITRNRIHIQEILDIQAKKDFINSLDLNKIDFIGNDGNKIVIDQKIIDDFKFVGLNNFDFIATEFYKGGLEEKEIKNGNI
jgi:hypothetical protein